MRQNRRIKMLNYDFNIHFQDLLLGIKENEYFDIVLDDIKDFKHNIVTQLADSLHLLNEGNVADEATANHPKFKKLNDEISKIADEINAKSRSGKNWFSCYPPTKDICDGLLDNGVELGLRQFPLSEEEVQARIKIIMDSPIQKSEHPVQLHVQRG